MAALRDGGETLQYGLPNESLKRHIVDLMAERGVLCRPEEVFLTSGAQQAMALLVRLLLDPGGTVFLEEAIYDGILLSMQGLAARVVTVPSDAREGINLDALERQLAAGACPAFLYVVPEGHNPLGTSLSLSRRERLIEIARRYRLPILEDDVYGLLSYDGPGPPALRALDDRLVIYLGSFSKILSPSLRVGWIVISAELAPKLSALKQGADVDVATFPQHALARYLSSGALSEHLVRIRTEYSRRRDAIVVALERHFSDKGKWCAPQSGIFVWVRLLESLDTLELLQAALARGVAFCPGEAFSAGNSPLHCSCLRLAYANTPVDCIEKGIARLAQVVERNRQGLEGNL